MSTLDYTVCAPKVSHHLRKGLHMASARTGIPIRDLIVQAVYRVVDEALVDYPERLWKRGQGEQIVLKKQGRPKGRKDSYKRGSGGQAPV
jgi:hypothetical protein